MKLTLSQEANQKIAWVYAETLRRQIRDRIDANGNPFPPGITLQRSGNLLRSIQGRIAGEEGQIFTDVVYSEFLNNRFNFAGIAPQNQAELEAKVQKIIEESVELSEE